MKKNSEPKVSKRAPNPYDFCPKHNVFYASCGCDHSKKKKVEEVDIEPIDPKTL